VVRVLADAVRRIAAALARCGFGNGDRLLGQRRLFFLHS
jgi:hypothetical protein